MRTDAELLETDFGGFYERHVDTLTGYVSRRARRPDLTFDLVAETFARALEHRCRYEAARGPAIASVEDQSIAFLDGAGRRPSTRNAFAGRDPSGRAVDPGDPPDARCAIRAGRLPGLRAVSAGLLTAIATRPAIAPSYLACATTVYYLGKWRVRAAVLLNAADPDAQAPPLPPSRFLAGKRAGNGWLVAFGADKTSRERVLAVLRTRA
jgi:hypothetical protein